MEEQLALQGEETLRTSQQSQDQIPHDPTAAARFPGGYTPAGDGVDNTQVETAPSSNVDAVEVTTNTEISNPALESYGSSGDNVVLRNITPAEAFKAYGIDITPIGKNDISFNPDIISFGGGNNVDDSIVADDLSEQDSPLNPPTPPVDPPVDPPTPPVDPPIDPPVDPDPEDPEDPEDPDPEDPDPEDPDPEDPEDPGKGNPGNDKEVGNSPWDGETGASDNPGKGNNQDGQDPEPNQPPGDSKNDGGQNNDEKDPPGNGGNGGKPENKQDNGWGNGDDDAPGNSLVHNNAENDQSPSGHYDDFIGRFLEENPVDVTYDTYNWEQDNNEYLDYAEQLNANFDYVPEIPEIPYEESPYFDQS